MAHPIKAPTHAPKPVIRRDSPVGQPQWPTFTGTATLAGTSAGGISVYYDATLGPQALQNAQDLLAAADKVAGINRVIFAQASQPPVSVIVFALGGSTDGTGGADHASCDFVTGQNIEVCASFGSSPRVEALFEAELSECCMGGNLCGVSTGEGLSRWCAMAAAGNVLPDFASVPVWDADGRPNWIDQTEQTDGGVDSTGCAMAFISWLQGPFTLAQIAQGLVSMGAGATLAQLYNKLTGDAAKNAWPKFSAALPAMGSLTSDDPFGALGRVPIPAPTPTPTQPGGTPVSSSVTVSVGHSITCTIEYLDQNGNPMQTTPTPDATPVWANTSSTVESLAPSPDGSSCVATALAAGNDAITLSLTVGGASFSDSLSVTVQAAAQVLTAIKIVPVVGMKKK